LRIYVNLKELAHDAWGRLARAYGKQADAEVEPGGGSAFDSEVIVIFHGGFYHRGT